MLRLSKLVVGQVDLLPTHPSMIKGAVTLWSNTTNLWCQDFSEIKVQAPVMVASQQGLRCQYVSSSRDPSVLGSIHHFNFTLYTPDAGSGLRLRW